LPRVLLGMEKIEKSFKLSSRGGELNFQRFSQNKRKNDSLLLKHMTVGKEQK